MDIIIRYVFVFILLSCFNLSYASNEIEFSKEEISQWKRAKVTVNNDSSKKQGIISIGRDLFFDTRLSGNYKTSCASCHSPSLGWSDGLARPVGYEGKILARTSPTILNVHQLSTLMWDGRTESLQQQVLLPITSPNEMNLPFNQIEKRISDVPSYLVRFNRYYENGITLENITDSIAKFEKTIVSTESRFDQWIEGDEAALTQQEKLGFSLFSRPDKGNCKVCHQAPNFTDEGFHNIGLVDLLAKDADLGRYNIKSVAILKGAFRTPSLRDVTLTAPYFHDGSADNLDELLKYYISGGRFLENISPEMKPAALDEMEQKAVIAFIKTLSSI